MFRDRTYFILVCLFAIFWQWKQPVLDSQYYSQLAWQHRQTSSTPVAMGSTVSKLNTDPQPLIGVTVIITGATSGLGFGIAKNLYRMGATLITVGRSSTKLLSVKNVLTSMDSTESDSSSPTTTVDRVHMFVADFTDLVSVSKAADSILKQFDSIDYLINNAGMYHAATLETMTLQGYEIVFGVNYLAHVLWTAKLLPLLKKSPLLKNKDGGARVIQISSTMHGAVDGSDLSSNPPLASVPLNTMYQKSRSYSNSKLAQIYHSRALNRQLAKDPKCDGGGSSSCIRVINVCPSWVGTSISASNSAEFIMKQLGYEADGFGVASTLHAMFHPNASTTLDYVSNNKNFASSGRFATKILGTYRWLDSSNLRVKIWTSVSVLLLLIEKFIPDTGFVDSSEESYNETKQDALYAWSLRAIQPFL